MRLKRIPFIFFLFVILCSCSKPNKATLPNFHSYDLVNQDGKVFRLKDFSKGHLLVSFFFTRCPKAKVCPLTLELNKQTHQALKHKKTSLKHLLITLDTQYDTPNKLKQYGRLHQLDFNDFTLATSTKEITRRIATELAQISFLRQGNGLIAHTTKTVLLAPNLKALGSWRNNKWNADSILALLPFKDTSEINGFSGKQFAGDLFQN